MRRKDICPLFSRCGGCDYSLSYKEELQRKTEYVHSLFYSHCPTYETIGSSPTRYRNKVASTFGYDRKGNIISGLYIKGTHHLIEKRDCQLEFEEASGILRAIRRLMKSYRMRCYDEDARRGDLRHVLLRKGHRTGEILVLLIFGSDRYERKKEFANSLCDMCPEITTVCYQVNGEKTSMLLSEAPVHTLIGKGFIESRLFGLTFRVSPASFFQVNADQTEVLYDMAMHMADLHGNEKVLDAYSGTGTIAMIVSLRAKCVTAVESNHGAVLSAIRSAKDNAIENVSFVENDASLFLKAEAARKERYDVAFLDPPRSGSDERFLSSLIKLSPEKIVYISCNPETQERDLRYLERFGPYVPIAIQPVDMFPRTAHVETVLLLVKGKM